MQSSFSDITIRHRCSPLHLPHIFRTSLPQITPGGLDLYRVLGMSRNCDYLSETVKLFHDKVLYHIETSQLICTANQWTGFFMIHKRINPLSVRSKCFSWRLISFNYKSSSVAVRTDEWYKYIPMSGFSTSIISLISCKTHWLMV